MLAASICSGYVVGFLITLYLLRRYFDLESATEDRDSVAAGTCAVVCSIFWPLALIGMAAIKIWGLAKTNRIKAKGTVSLPQAKVINIPDDYWYSEEAKKYGKPK